MLFLIGRFFKFKYLLFIYTRTVNIFNKPAFLSMCSPDLTPRDYDGFKIEKGDSQVKHLYKRRRRMGN